MNQILMNVPRKQKLLTKTIEKKLPKFYETENVKPENKVAVVKFFTPASNWTWYGIEYDSEQKVFFGYVCGFEKEFGYFSLNELEEMNSAVERDMYFSPTKLSELKDYEWYL